MHLRRGVCATTTILVLAAPAASGTPVDDRVPDVPVGEGPSAAQASDVMVIDNEFDPEGLTVTEGTTVVWEHTGNNPHTVTADDGSFDSHENCPPVCMQNGDTYEMTFGEAGQVPYFCKIHGSEGGGGMSGTITVEAEQTTAAGTVDDTDDQTAAAPADTAGDETAAAPSDTTADGDPLPVTGGGVSGLAGSAMLVGAAALLYVTRHRAARGEDGGA